MIDPPSVGVVGGGLLGLTSALRPAQAGLASRSPSARPGSSAGASARPTSADAASRATAAPLPPRAAA